jgi:hypothetical protein
LRGQRSPLRIFVAVAITWQFAEHGDSGRTEHGVDAAAVSREERSPGRYRAATIVSTTSVDSAVRTELKNAWRYGLPAIDR